MTQEERKSRQWMFIAGVAVAVGGALYLLYQNRSSSTEPPEPPVEPQTEEPETIEPPKAVEPTEDEIRIQQEKLRMEEERRRRQERIDNYKKRQQQIDNSKNFNYKNGTLQIDVIKALNLDPHDKDGTNDPWCKLKVGSTTQKTKVVKNTNNPTWNQSFTFKVTDPCKENIVIEIYDKDMITSDHIGKVELRVTNVIRYQKNGYLQQPFYIIGSKQRAQLFLKMRYTESNTKN